MEWPHQWGRFLKLASVKRVKAACVCLFVVFFSLFQILWKERFFKNNSALFNS